MSSSIDLDTAKDRVADTLTNARDVTTSAVRDEIAPAVAAAVGAAIEASAPLRAEAASRAGDAIDALLSSEVAERAREAAGQPSQKSKRRYVLLGATAVGLGAIAVKLRKSGKPGAAETVRSYPTATPPPEPTTASPDAEPEAG